MEKSYKCLGCNNIIYPEMQKGKKRKFCSINCAQRFGYNRRKTTLTRSRLCIFCKKPIEASRPTHTKYCDSKCRDKFIRKGITYCQNCNKDMSLVRIRRKYCSQICADISYHKDRLFELQQVFSLR